MIRKHDTDHKVLATGAGQCKILREYIHHLKVGRSRADPATSACAEREKIIEKKQNISKTA